MSDTSLVIILPALMLATLTMALVPMDGIRITELLTSDIALRTLAIAIFVGSTALLLSTSRRDWKRLAECERRAPGLLSSLGFEVRGVHAEPLRGETGGC